jgi:hypothetical protein
VVNTQQHHAISTKAFVFLNGQQVDIDWKLNYKDTSLKMSEKLLLQQNLERYTGKT